MAHILHTVVYNVDHNLNEPTYITKSVESLEYAFKYQRLVAHRKYVMQSIVNAKITDKNN